VGGVLAELQAVSEKPLVESAVAQGRYVTTYRDGESPVRASLLFRTAEEAQECARVLAAARIGRG
jgi:hypothetical protein